MLASIAPLPCQARGFSLAVAPGRQLSVSDIIDPAWQTVLAPSNDTMPGPTTEALHLQQQLLSLNEHIDSLLRQQQQVTAQLVSLCCEPIEEDPRMKQPISTLLISNWIVVKLRRHDVLTIGDVCALGLERLLNLPKIGDGAISELCRAMEHEGLQITSKGTRRPQMLIPGAAHDLSSAA